MTRAAARGSTRRVWSGRGRRCGGWPRPSGRWRRLWGNPRGA